MMPVADFLEKEPVVILEGAVIERLRRGGFPPLDPLLLNAPWVYSESERNILGGIYRGYIECARRRNFPTVVLTPTWRANPERIAESGYGSKDVNGDCMEFLAGIRTEFGPAGDRIRIGGLMGCRGDAYNPRDALSINEADRFHREQAATLAGAGADFLIGSTLPAVSEATGMAQAMSRTGKPYILSFIVRPEGSLLDGTMLSDAITGIDALAEPRPTLYLVNCVHPDNFRKAMVAPGQDLTVVADRVAGLQANTSRRSPEELDGRETLDGEDPDVFGSMMAGLHDDFSLRLLGGCCGTDNRHIDAIVSSLSL